MPGVDVLAGVSVALVVIPQALAYAELAGLPAVHGLAAAAVAPLAAAAFASSPALQTGPTAMSAVLVFVGAKMIAESARHSAWLAERGGWDPHAEGHLVPPWLSLLVIVGLIGTSVAASLAFPASAGGEMAERPPDGPDVRG